MEGCPRDDALVGVLAFGVVDDGPREDALVRVLALGVVDERELRRVSDASRVRLRGVVCVLDDDTESLSSNGSGWSS